MAKFAPFPEWKWDIPEYFNIGTACLDAHLGTDKAGQPAIIVEDDELGVSQASYAELAARSSRFDHSRYGGCVMWGRNVSSPSTAARAPDRRRSWYSKARTVSTGLYR